MSEHTEGKGPSYTFNYTKEDFTLLRRFAVGVRSKAGVVSHILWWMYQYWYDQMGLHRSMNIAPRLVTLASERPRPEGTMTWRAPGVWEITEVLWVAARVRENGQGSTIAWMAEMLRVNGEAFLLYREVQKRRWQADLERQKLPTNHPAQRYHVTEFLPIVFTPDGDTPIEETSNVTIYQITNRESPAAEGYAAPEHVGVDGEPQTDSGTGHPVHDRGKGLDTVRGRTKL